MTIAIVTPWTDHLELADDYFEAVLPEMEEGDELIVVDNASEPSLAFGTVRSERNLGYAGGSNFGARAATTDAVLFLNNDVALERRGWLDGFRQAVEPGVLAGHIRYDRHADVDGRSFPYLDGWCLSIMRKDFLALGGFDQTLEEPAYFSDNLLCLEARARGMTLREVKVGLMHLENVTAGPYYETTTVRLANWARYLARARELLIAA
jgi:GT2 family glycosyltransferase